MADLTLVLTFMLFLTMRRHVTLQIGFARKTAATLFTLELLFTSVSSHVSFQVVVLTVRLTTDVTNVGPLVGVYTPVFIQVGFVVEALVTLGAFEWFFSCMDDSVILHIPVYKMVKKLPHRLT